MTSRPTPERRRAWHRGRTAEWLCRTALRLKGYRILASRCRTPLGEIDIIARHRDTLVIIEVKARADLAQAAAAIGPGQRRRLVRAADWFRAARGDLAALPCRFDVMLVAPRSWPRHVADAWRPD